MRILLVTGLVAGGVGAHVQQLAQGLRSAGHEVAVASPPVVAERFDLGEAHLPVDIADRPAPSEDLRSVRTLAAAMRGADVVHAHGLRAGALAVLARAARLRTRRPRLVVTTHNAAPAGRAASAAYRIMEQLVARGADLVLGVSPDLVERARSAGARGPQLAVVPANPAPELGTAAREQVRERVRDELGLPTGPTPLLVVSVGRLAAQKDQGTLVLAFADALGRPATPPAVLAIAGEGPERPALERLVAGLPVDVRLLGHRGDVPDLLAAADLVVSGARWEGQPVWLQEALQQGAPVVATDVGGTATVLGDAAVLVPSGEPGLVDRLAEAIAALLGDDEQRERLQQAARTRAGELPTEADAVAAALAAYDPAPAATPGRAAAPSPGSVT